MRIPRDKIISYCTAFSCQKTDISFFKAPGSSVVAEHLTLDYERNRQQRGHFKRNFSDRQAETGVQKHSEKYSYHEDLGKFLVLHWWSCFSKIAG